MKKIPKPQQLAKAAATHLGGEVASAVPALRVELLQNRQAIVEGCKGVLEYSETCIRLSNDRLILKFAGSGLRLKAFAGSAAIVEGQIDSLDFM